MCGIVGVIDNKGNSKLIGNMTKTLLHRGPDDFGIYEDKSSGVYLGHTRLSILDLSNAGHQPMVSECGNYVITYNGEVYNYKEIRNCLEKKGYRFFSNTDTEVVLKAFIHWGKEAIFKFIGMFAFALYDKKQKKLILVRDRAGVKPLYYYWDNDIFMFASEIKAFHKHPKFKKKINKAVLPFYFQFGYIPSTYSIFENCFKLEAGHYLEYDIRSKSFDIHKYWDVEDIYALDKFDKSEDEIVNELEEILTDAISKRLISDVPVGVFLSGGYDSSFISAILAKKLGKKINTFTIGFQEEKYNEARHAKRIANYLGTNHTEYYMSTKDFFDVVDLLPQFYDEPFGDSSSLATILVSNIAKEKVKVVLSGDGGDETFIGYSKYFALMNLSGKGRLLKLILKIATYFPAVWESVNKLLPEKRRQSNLKERILKLKRTLHSDNIKDMFILASSYVDPIDVKKILNIEENSIVNVLFKNKKNLSKLDYMLSKDYKLFMKDDVLVKVDRATMGVGIEGREPLLDHRIIEYVARIPEDIRFKKSTGKYLMRKILYKYIPQNIIDKPKSGFQIPLEEWLRGDLKYLLDKYLSKDKLDDSVFKISEVRKAVNKFLKGKESPHKIWFILMFQMWREKWLG